MNRYIQFQRGQPQRNVTVPRHHPTSPASPASLISLASLASKFRTSWNRLQSPCIKGGGRSDDKEWERERERGGRGGRRRKWWRRHRRLLRAAVAIWNQFTPPASVSVSIAAASINHHLISIQLSIPLSFSLFENINTKFPNNINNNNINNNNINNNNNSKSMWSWATRPAPPLITMNRLGNVPSLNANVPS